MDVLTGFEHIIRQAEPLAPYTWLRLGGPAQYFAEPTSVEELAALVRRCHELEIPLRVLGGGSNVLVRDEGTPGMIIHLSAAVFAEIRREGDRISAGGGAILGHVISTSVREGLGGLEALVGIPGTIGGALHGNAGSRSGDIGRLTWEATVMTREGEIITRQRDEMTFAYRQSSLDDLVILGAQFKLEPEDPVELTKRMQKHWIVKKTNQPLSHQSTGCIFRNPQGMNAGQLIEEAGLKGTRVGGAEVSDRHANFIVADPGATSHDVLRLMEIVRSRVLERTGVQLENEIKIW